MPIRHTIYLIEKGSKPMKKTNTERAYKAIKDYVQTHVNGDADDACCACCNTYDRIKDKYNEAKGKIEDFAAGVARRQVSNSRDAEDDRKCREKGYTDLYNLDRGHKIEKRRICVLVEQAMKKLSPEERGIIAWILCGFELQVLQAIWGISEQAFFKHHVNPARQRFAEAFGKVVGNPKLYAKLRVEVLAKGKEQK